MPGDREFDFARLSVVLEGALQAGESLNLAIAHAQMLAEVLGASDFSEDAGIVEGVRQISDRFEVGCTRLDELAALLRSLVT